MSTGGGFDTKNLKNTQHIESSFFFCCLMTVAGHWSWHPSVTRRQFSASSSDFNQEFIKSSQNYQSKSRGVHIVCLPAMSHVCQDILTKRDEGFQMYQYTCMEGEGFWMFSVFHIHIHVSYSKTYTTKVSNLMDRVGLIFMIFIWCLGFNFNDCEESFGNGHLNC